MTEDQLEQETLGWLAELGYAVLAGPDIAHDGPNPQRVSYRQVLLPFCLREAIGRLAKFLEQYRQRRAKPASVHAIAAKKEAARA